MDGNDDDGSCDDDYDDNHDEYTGSRSPLRLVTFQLKTDNQGCHLKNARKGAFTAIMCWLVLYTRQSGIKGGWKKV